MTENNIGHEYEHYLEEMEKARREHEKFRQEMWDFLIEKIRPSSSIHHNPFQQDMNGDLYGVYGEHGTGKSVIARILSDNLLMRRPRKHVYVKEL